VHEQIAADTKVVIIFPHSDDQNRRKAVQEALK